MDSSEKTVDYHRKLIQKGIKRFFDIIASLLGLLITSPITLVVVIAIKFESSGPVLFKQWRSGKNNVPFQIYKFRSMHEGRNESKVVGTYNWPQGVPDDFVFKSTACKQNGVTKVGAFIRKYSLDEIPQFLNILKGEMSFVGPRPEIIEISQNYNLTQKIRLQVKPGLTGWAQVNGRSNINHGKKIDLDIYYVEHWSINLDLKILMLTFFKVIRSADAI
ncbi:sugar transferase [Listeria aquatica]|uniref:sugar transferase n=1 Tax=Listeria aquatica TaxID=1494960 RepID=UPI0031452D46